MKVIIEVKRIRQSVTQGFAEVTMNGHHVITFADDIQIIKDGMKYYGDKIGSWASVIPDYNFIKGCICHKYESVYDYHKDILNALDAIRTEESENGEV